MTLFLCSKCAGDFSTAYKLIELPRPTGKCSGCDLKANKWEWRGVQDDSKKAYGNTCEQH